METEINIRKLVFVKTRNNLKKEIIT